MPRGRFLSDEPRVYANVPVTASKGDVVDWPDGIPDDGHWEDAGDAKVTRLPDNSPDAQPVDAAPLPASVTDPESLGDQYEPGNDPDAPIDPPADPPADSPAAPDQTPADPPAAK